MKRILGALLAALLMLSLVACGGKDADNDSDKKAEPSADPKPTVQVELPPNWHSVTADDSALSFGVPTNWRVLDADKLNNPASKQMLAQSAKGMNMSADQMMQVLKSLDIMVIAPKPTNGFTENLNVVLVPIDELPSEAMLKTQFKRVNAEVLSFAKSDSSVGEGTLVELSLPAPGGKRAYGSGFFVKLSKGIVNVTVSGPTTQIARDRMAKVLKTLKDVG